MSDSHLGGIDRKNARELAARTGGMSESHLGGNDRKNAREFAARTGGMSESHLGGNDRKNSRELAAVVTVAGVKGGDGGGVMRWVEPEYWGFAAWSVIYAAAERADADARFMPPWLSLVRLLPDTLPCHTCRRCCAKFIARRPPEREVVVNKSGKGAMTSADAWCSELRAAICARNAKAPDCNRLERGLYAACASTDQSLDRRRFALRRAVPSLWLMDAFLFLALVARTVNLALPHFYALAAAIQATASHPLQLSPPPAYLGRESKSAQDIDRAVGSSGAVRPLGLTLGADLFAVTNGTYSPHESALLAAALEWLISSPSCPSAPLLAALVLCPVKSRPLGSATSVPVNPLT
jgi:hypothetical protein